MRGKKTDNREQEISDISRSLKALAKELHIPVIALSQLSRMTERRDGNKPQLSDLRESGAIEQDADVVMFVYRESLYKPCDCPRELCTCGQRRMAEVIVAKQRNGPTDNINHVPQELPSRTRPWLRCQAMGRMAAEPNIILSFTPVFR